MKDISCGNEAPSKLRLPSTATTLLSVCITIMLFNMFFALPSCSSFTPPAVEPVNPCS